LDLLAVRGEQADLMRVGVPDSGMPKNLTPLARVEVDELIARVWEKQDGRHGVMFACDAVRSAVTNGAGAKTAAVAS